MISDDNSSIEHWTKSFIYRYSCFFNQLLNDCFFYYYSIISLFLNNVHSYLINHLCNSSVLENPSLKRKCEIMSSSTKYSLSDLVIPVIVNSDFLQNYLI